MIFIIGSSLLAVLFFTIFFMLIRENKKLRAQLKKKNFQIRVLKGEIILPPFHFNCKSFTAKEDIRPNMFVKVDSAGEVEPL